MADENNQLFREIDQSVLETCAGGFDSRPFDSKLFLAAPFHEEFLTTLNASSVNESSSSSLPTTLPEKGTEKSPAQDHSEAQQLDLKAPAVTTESAGSSSEEKLHSV